MAMGKNSQTRRGLSKALADLQDDELIKLRARLEAEMRRRHLAFSVGQIGEALVIEHFNHTRGLPKLLKSPTGTKNVDALSRDGDRYSIKTICTAKKTGTIYPDRDDKNKQLFEFLLVARLADDFTLNAIYQFSWRDFVKIRSWDKRMNAWYAGCSNKTLCSARLLTT